MIQIQVKAQPESKRTCWHSAFIKISPKLWDEQLSEFVKKKKPMARGPWFQ